MGEEKVKAVLSLDNCILPDEKIKSTPSKADGLSVDDEVDIRILGCDFIQSGGILLELPQVAMATAQILFQRFFYSKSLVKHSYEHVAMSCLFLAAKIEESPRRVRDVINVFHHIKQFWNEKPFEPMEYMGNQFFISKNAVIKAERRILKELGFCVHVKHPHKLITTYLQILDNEKNKKLVQLAWNYMNDSLRSNVFLRYSPEAIACACIHIAARKLKDQVPLPSNPPWYFLFDVSLDEIEMVSYTILSLYNRKRRSPAELEQCVAKAKESITGKKGDDMDGISSANSPATSGVSPRPDSPSTTGSTTASDEKTVPSAGYGEDRSSLPKSGERDAARSPNHSPDLPNSKHVENGRHGVATRGSPSSVSGNGASGSSSDSSSLSDEHSPRATFVRRKPSRSPPPRRRRRRRYSSPEEHSPYRRYSRSRSPRSYSRSRSRSRSRSSSVERSRRYRDRMPPRRDRPTYSSPRSPYRRKNRERRDHYRDWDRDHRRPYDSRRYDDRDHHRRRRR